MCAEGWVHGECDHMALNGCLCKVYGPTCPTSSTPVTREKRRGPAGRGLTFRGSCIPWQGPTNRAG